MSLIPTVGIYSDPSGTTYVLVRQAASGGQYITELCLTMGQFSALMLLLRGMERELIERNMKDKTSQTMIEKANEEEHADGSARGVQEYDPTYPWMDEADNDYGMYEGLNWTGANEKKKKRQERKKRPNTLLLDTVRGDEEVGRESGEKTVARKKRTTLKTVDNLDMKND